MFWSIGVWSWHTDGEVATGITDTQGGNPSSPGLPEYMGEDTPEGAAESIEEEAVESIEEEATETMEEEAAKSKRGRASDRA